MVYSKLDKGDNDDDVDTTGCLDDGGGEYEYMVDNLL